MLDSKRQGEIALTVLKCHLRKKGVTLSKDSMRRLGNVSKEIGMTIEELKEFFRPLVQELLDECFDGKK